MTPDNELERRSTGVFVAVGAAIGSGLGAAAAVTTGNWTWMPVVMAVSIGFGGLAASVMRPPT